jgi:tRNA nucleotidyltransferase (CCA-adding enzyme)
MTLEAEILKRIKPTPAQDKKVASVVEQLSEKVLKEAKKLDVHIVPMLVGSVAKSTHLKDPDIDLFMLYPESASLDQLKETGLEIGRRILGGKEHYAQHPYVRGMFSGFQVDLVPAFKIRDTRRKMSAVDRTPFHTEFVKKNLGKEEEDQVRLLKRFMKGTECYGAEAKVQGFSGYLCELLVMRFGSFREVLKAASAWKVGEHIELLDYPGKEFEEPLTFIDPVDSGRNVASAVAVETMLRLVMACREYLADPDEKFFFPEPREAWDVEKIEEIAGDRLGNIVAVSLPVLDLIDDVLYPQLKKSISSVAAMLERADFEVEKLTIHVDDSNHLLIELSSMKLPKEKKHRGPPVSSVNADEFLAKWKTLGISEPYPEDGRWFVMARREFTRADDLLKAKLKETTLGKDIKKIDDSIEIASGDALLEDRYLAAITHHLDDRMPWQR